MPKIDSSSPSLSNLPLIQFRHIARGSRRAGIIDWDTKRGTLYTRSGRGFSIRAIVKDFFYRITGRETPSELRKRSIIQQFQSILEKQYQDIGSQAFNSRFSDPSLWQKSSLTPDHVSQIFDEITQNINAKNKSFLQSHYFQSEGSRLSQNLQNILYSLTIPDEIQDSEIAGREKAWIHDLSQQPGFQQRLKRLFDQEYRHQHPEGKALDATDVKAITARIVKKIPELQNIANIYQYHPNLSRGKFSKLYPRIEEKTSPRQLRDFLNVLERGNLPFLYSIEKIAEDKSGSFRNLLDQKNLEEIVLNASIAYIEGKPLRTTYQPRKFLTNKDINQQNLAVMIQHHPYSNAYRFNNLLEKSDAWPPTDTHLSLPEIIHRKEEIFERMAQIHYEDIFRDMTQESDRISQDNRIITNSDTVTIIGKTSRRYLEKTIARMEEKYPELRDRRVES